MPIDANELRGCRLFQGFTDAGLGILAQIASKRELAAGLSLFKKGSSGDALYVVSKGRLEVVAELSGQPRVLLTLAPGDHFGELALLRPGQRAVTVRALEASQLIEIKRGDFNETLKTKPQACIKLLLAIFAAVEARLAPLKDELLMHV